MGEKFIIPLSGLSTGVNEFSWLVGKEFFESFENSEVLDASLDVDVRVEKSGRYVGVDCNVTGDVTVECDRCLEDLVIPMDIDIMLTVKYGDEESSDEHQPGEREVIFVPEDSPELELGQIVYDYVCISLPIQRMHDEGECNEEVVRYLEPETECTDAEIQDNPFSALKNMFE